MSDDPSVETLETVAPDFTPARVEAIAARTGYSRFPRLRGRPPHRLTEELHMATSERGNGGLTLGGIIVIVGIVVMIVWSILIGLIIALIGLVAFGGFARGKWY